MKHWRREPLVHFFILGILLFIGHGVWERYVTKDDYTLHISAAELERQAEIFASENRRQPTDEDLKALLFAHVEEQVLMREAERLGLSDNDTIIRRRLAQKMRFMIEDTTPAPEVDEAALQDWFVAHKDQFTQAETRSFSHIYLSPDTRGDNIDQAAADILSQASDDNWRNLGDPFIEQRQFTALSRDDTTRLFGAKFASQMFGLDPGQWQGPIPSAFGLHIVKVDNVTPMKIPSFEEARAQIMSAWQDRARRQNNQQRLKDIIAKYKVVVEEPDP